MVLPLVDLCSVFRGFSFLSLQDVVKKDLALHGAGRNGNSAEPHTHACLV
jgi:hypothetical protein